MSSGNEFADASRATPPVGFITALAPAESASPCHRHDRSAAIERFARGDCYGLGWGESNVQCPSETTSTVPSVTLMAV